MYEYEFVTLETHWGTGYSLFGGVRIDTVEHREIIRHKALEGWRFVTYIPTTQHASGQIDEIDLVFEREVQS